MHNETNEQGFMQNVMQKNVSLGFVLPGGGWTRSKGRQKIRIFAAVTYNI